MPRIAIGGINMKNGELVNFGTDILVIVSSPFADGNVEGNVKDHIKDHIKDNANNLKKLFQQLLLSSNN